MKTQISQRRAGRRLSEPSSKAVSSKQRPGLKGRLKPLGKSPAVAGHRKRSPGVDLAEQPFSPANSGKPQTSARPENPNPQPTPAAGTSQAVKSSIAPWAQAMPAFEPPPSQEPVAEKEGETNRTENQQGFGAPYGYFREGETYPDPFPYEPPTEAEAAALRLTPAQRTALEKITLGSQLSVAARAAGVTRMTLYRWLHHDPNFQAAYNIWQMDAIVNSRARILAITNTATTTLEFAVQTDPRMALALLRYVGIMQHVHHVPTEPEECKREIDRLERQAQSQMNGAKQRGSAQAPVAEVRKAVEEPLTDPSIENAPTNEKHVESEVDQKETDLLPAASLQSPALTSSSQQPIAQPSGPATVISPQSTLTNSDSLPPINGRIEASAAANDPHSSEEGVAGLTNPQSESAARIPQDVTLCNLASLGHGVDGAGKVEVLCRSDLP